MPYLNALAAAPAVLAALSLTISSPAEAAEMPLPVKASTNHEAVPALDIEASQTVHHGRHHRYRYRRSGIGDVLTGVLIVGAIAHVAKAASRDDRRYRDRGEPDRDYRRDAGWDADRGLDRAVQMCVDAVEREGRVESVDRADRNARGWSVEGTLARGGGFDCTIDNDGRGVEVNLRRDGARYEGDDRGYEEDYEDIDYREDDRGYRDSGEVEDGQWEDDRYASEWSKVDSAEPAETARAPQPSYPGGPVDGDEQVGGDLQIGTGYPGAGA